MTILFADTTINPSGLMRCDMETIREYVGEHLAEHVPSTPLVISCKYESGRPLNIILAGGAWRWNFATQEE